MDWTLRISWRGEKEQRGLRVVAGIWMQIMTTYTSLAVRTAGGCDISRRPSLGFGDQKASVKDEMDRISLGENKSREWRE
jgi:hypothetical protein